MSGIRPDGRAGGRTVGRSGFFFGRTAGRAGGRAVGLLFFEKNTFLDFWNMYFVDFVISERFQGPLVKKSKYDRSDQMTRPGRRASKFSAKRRAIMLHIIFSKSDFSSNSWILRTLV